ncbi:kinase-like domain-containing protein, partial [Staphylotrichum tortipilum]
MAPPQPYPAPGAPSASTAPNGLMQQQPSLWRRWLPTRGKDSGADGGPSEPANKGLDFGHQQQHQHQQPDDTKTGVIRRVSRAVVPGLPRTQTFKRQRSELRSKLEAVRPTPAERRAVSMDRRVHPSVSALNHSDPRASAPDFLNRYLSAPSSPPSLPMSPPERVPDLYDGRVDDHSDDDLDGDAFDHLDRDSTGAGHFAQGPDNLSRIDLQSMTTSQYDEMIEGELERKWILNLSMHFRDKSKREKFFVTFRQHEHHWRRVTISLDYRTAQDGSLEAELARAQYQREKSAKIYEAIRESLAEIDFYNTVTNLKLETKDGRLHVHVVEDTNEIICYPPVRMVQHMGCRRVKEREIHFDSHMSGFVYKVRVHGRLLIKKEIPGPDSVDEFLYEINALNQLYPSRHVIEFYGVVVDDHEENVTGLLISYASHGALIDAIYDRKDSLPWATREKWARQIVAGLSEIHEAGFVQGDFTLSNIVVDDKDDAKIIDINRRGCPIGWEPPEVTPLVDSSQRISMYIGVKSDLFQLGMVLWALAALDDEPEAHARPLEIDAASEAPGWYRRIVSTCLSPNPRNRSQAIKLLSCFPDHYEVGSQHGRPGDYPMSVDGNSRSGYLSPSGMPRVMTVRPPSDWAYVSWNGHNPGGGGGGDDSFYHPSRGRSPPSPMPSNQGDMYGQRMGGMQTWSDVYHHHRAPTVPSVSDVLARGESETRGGETYADARFGGYGTETSGDDYSVAERDRSP